MTTIAPPPGHKKTVGLLLTGGTLVMQAGAHGALEPDAYRHDLVAELPVLDRIASFKPRVVCNLDSGDMQPEDWVKIARATHEMLADRSVDGVVVIHGTDTMAYTASATAFMLGPLPKPVIFTGAQRPLSYARTDARPNVVDACFLATLGVPEVGIAFASKMLRAVRAKKRDAWALEAFDSPNLGCLVDLGLDEMVAPHVRAPSPLSPFDGRLDTRVVCLRAFPGLDPQLLLGPLDRGAQGVVIEAYGTGNLPHLERSLIEALSVATSRDVPVLVVSQCFRGAVDLPRYAGGAAALKAGAISGGDMTVEAALAKMMVGLGRHRGAELRAYLERDVVGEKTGAMS